MCGGDYLMSIIHNALKKTQNKIDGKDKEKPQSPFFNPNPTPTEPPPTPPPTTNDQNNPGGKSSKNNKVIIIAIVLIVLLAGGVGYFIIGGKNTSSQPTVIVEKTSPVVEGIPAEGSGNIKSLVKQIEFQGTASNGNSIAALINDDIYEEGQVVNGLTIKSIKKNELILEMDGQTVTIKP